MENSAEYKVVLVQGLGDAVRQLQQQDFTAAVVDQVLIESEPDEAELFLQHLGTAMPVFVTFAICGMDRLLREVRIALQRRRRELEAAGESAQEALRNQIRGSLTAMLLSCELALQVENVPPAAMEKLIQVSDLAHDMSGKLGDAR